MNNNAKLIVANRKMNFFNHNAINFCKKITSNKRYIKNKFVICPPSILLFQLKKIVIL